MVIDQRATADGQGVVYAPRNSGNTPMTLRLGKGATYTVNNGIGGDALAALQAKIDILGRAVGPEQAAGNSFREATANRATGQITDAPAESKKLGLVNWILIGVGVFILVGASLWKFKGKKK